MTAYFRVFIGCYQRVEMNTKIERKLHDRLLEALLSGNDESFDFELWANKVRPQLLAALQKQGNQIIPLPQYEFRGSEKVSELNSQN